MTETKVDLKKIDTQDLLAELLQRPGVVRSVFTIADLESQLEAPVASAKPAPEAAHTTSELFERITGTSVDAPLCLTCGTKMRPSGSCYVCEGCGSTSGCS